tara:strand:+ start:241 stop:885 length:645 start_codon:yes stop_codon:yes gene_type:complete
MKLDTHVHTTYSGCGRTKPFILNKIIKKSGVNVALTDHNTMDGVKEVPGCIPGEEITTDKREHILGLFLNERVKPCLSAEETIDKIHAQGALAVIVHPFDRVRRRGIQRTDLKADAIEVFNARVLFKTDLLKTLEHVKKLNIPKTVGSDAHTPYELAKTYVEIKDFSSPKEFLKNLKTAKLVMKRHPLYAYAYTHPYSAFTALKRNLGLKPAWV